MLNLMPKFYTKCYTQCPWVSSPDTLSQVTAARAMEGGV